MIEISEILINNFSHIWEVLSCLIFSLSLLAVTKAAKKLVAIDLLTIFSLTTSKDPPFSQK